MKSKITDEALADRVFDWAETDLRYAGGVAELYARMAAKLTGKKKKSFDDAAERFVDDTLQWHEGNRRNFKVHPEWRKRVAGRK